jgi:hypothetical protein
MHFVDIQFEGRRAFRIPHPDDVVRSQRQLAETGTFDEGIYTFASGRKRDAYEAILENLTGKPGGIPAEPARQLRGHANGAYPWVKTRNDGIVQRHLGYFFECGPNLKMLSLKSGSSLAPGEPTVIAHCSSVGQRLVRRSGLRCVFLFRLSGCDALRGDESHEGTASSGTRLDRSLAAAFLSSSFEHWTAFEVERPVFRRGQEH